LSCHPPVQPEENNEDILKHKALFTTSWDDGHPQDLRMAELLAKHGFSGTFYALRQGLPGACAGDPTRPVLSTPQLRQLAARFEIGAHSLDHVDLTAAAPDEARRQIVESKAWLEDETGRAVHGFCYPFGRHDAATRALVRNAGFAYARTISDLMPGPIDDPFQLPVSLQFYPRTRRQYARNFVKNGAWVRRCELTCGLLVGRDYARQLRGALDAVILRGGTFHLWGHSWELEGFDGWRVLDDFLRYAAERIAPENRVTNHESAVRGRAGTGYGVLAGSIAIGGLVAAPLVFSG
jgi:hypothetical protein